MASSRIGLLFIVILVAMALVTLSGCGFTQSATAYQTPAPLRGSVHGGNQTVSGASVQFYAAGTSGPGSTALPLLAKPVQSDSNGNFSIPASLSCPSSNSQVYVVARGGKPATLSGAGNPALELTAMLGSCNELSGYSSIFVNEVTTVGSVWPLAAFMTSASHLGYASGDASFLNAVASVPEFINIAQGNSPGKPTASSYFAENSKLYSLANVLADCVNSAGGSAGDGSPCGLLFSIATVQGGNAPTDTITAAMRIAQNPHNNVFDIFGLAKADTSYQPTLTSAPPDWTLTLTYLVATPTISLATGTYTGAQEVTISDSTPGSAIHYTTDGTVPTSSSPLYAGPLPITVSSTLQAIAVLEGSQSAIASSMLTITSALAPAKLAFLQQPSNALIGTTISPAIQVVIEDTSGNIVPAATNPVTIALIGGSGLAGTLTARPRNGVATFSNLSVSTAGTGYTLSAKSPNLASANSASFTINAPGGGTAPSPVKLAFLQQPSNATTGAAISPAVQVAVEDSSGNAVSSATNSVTLSPLGGTGLGGTLTVMPRNGIATFSNISIAQSGSSYQLEATSPGVTAAVSSTFAVSNSTAVSMAIVPNNINLTVSQGESFAATVSNSSNTAVTWSISPVVGTMSNGYYAPPASITTDQTITVTATSVADPTKRATATIVLNSPSATSSTAVQSLGAIPATQPLSGLGFNIDPTEWEFKLAAAAGTTHVRFQCGWISNESQTPPPLNQNTSTKYFLQPACQTALALSKQYGMHPTIIAGYGAPYHIILSVSVPGGAASGSKSINVKFASGVGGDTMQSLAPFYDTIIGPNNTQITSRNSYAGALVTAVTKTDATHATLTLASALTSALPANTTTQYTINEYLYPPAAISSPTDPSVLAFANYAEFLAQSIASAGLTGDVEIWNEPVWSPDPWDDRVNFYDTFPGITPPGPQAQGIPNYGLAAALQAQASPVAGVTYIWAGTNKSGDNSLLGPAMLANTGVSFSEPASTVASESFHPYGNNPEDEIWSEPCLQSTVKTYPATPFYFSVCNLNNASSGNFLKAAQDSLVQKSINANWGVAHNVTETGFSLTAGDSLHATRFVTRQFLGFQAAGVTPIEFYRLYDTSSAELTFTDPTSEAPLPLYTAIAGLMSDIALIKNAPLTSYSSSTLSSVASYSGTYVLDTVHIVGSRAGDSANSEIFALWQQSETANTGIWANLAQPAGGTVTVTIPTGSVVSAIVNLDTRAAVSYTMSGQNITFSVSDDPIEVMAVPAS